MKEETEDVKLKEQEEEGEKEEKKEEERVGNYVDTSIRYRGKHIPSPSFKLLKAWAYGHPLAVDCHSKS